MFYDEKLFFFLILNGVFEKWDDRGGHKNHDKNSATEIFC